MKRQNLSKGMFTGVRTWKGLLRPVWDNKMIYDLQHLKWFTTQFILLDPNSLSQDIKQANIQAYFWVHCMIEDMQKCDPCLSD